MQLFLDLSALNSDGGPCGAAYRLLRHAGHPLTIRHVPATGGCETTQRLTVHARPPELVTDAGDVIRGLSGIVAWIETRAADLNNPADRNKPKETDTCQSS